MANAGPPLGQRRIPRPALVLSVGVLLGAASASPPPPSGIHFTDRSAEWGLTFRHEDGATGRRHLPETMGSGLVWLDYDVDGHEDLYLVDGGALPGAPDPPHRDPRTPGANALYRNGGGRLDLVPGVAADLGYGKGVSAADYDGDGWTDLYVTNWGPDALYRNNGDGTYSEVTASAGLGDERLTSSAAWADLDGDSLLDLFVVTYVDYEPGTAPPCEAPGTGVRDYCHPAIFDGQPDILYRNLGDGTFEDRSEGLRLATPVYGKGLAVSIADLDGDGRPDIYVANDTTPNFVYFNRGDMRFVEEGELSGAALGDDGAPQAGMGISIADLDGDLSKDVLVTNFAREPYNLYRSIAPGFYVDDTYALGLGGATLALLGFGIVSADLDQDGDLDVLVANGHILRERVRTRQPNQAFSNHMTALRAAAVREGRAEPPGPPEEPPAPLGWRPRQALLREVTDAAGPALSRPRVSRGLALGDPDGDGWLDAAVSNVDGPAQLLINDSQAAGRPVVLRLRSRIGNRQAIGARAWVTPCADPRCEAAGDGVGGFPQTRRVRTGTSFQSQSTENLHVGLGAYRLAVVLIEWPDGSLESVRVVAGRIHLIRQGDGIVAVRPLARRRALLSASESSGLRPPGPSGPGPTR